MAKASSTPASKTDVQRLEKRFQHLEHVTKTDIATLGQELRNEMRESQKETIRQFKFIAEQIHKDAIDANKERIELHEDRITRLERYVGVPRSLSA